MIILDIFNQFPDQFPILETLISAFVAFFLGVLWYHPKVMGEKWAEAVGQDKSNVKITFAGYILAIVLWTISASVYSFLTTFLAPPAIGALLGLSTFLWIGFILPAVMIGGMFMGKKLMVMAVDSSYFLAGLYLFAVIHDVL
ncbi:MAG: hypothetical protein COB76_06645 [Alphaproteobacteria bacterium]|nr:MAG: hypothetical protein COB76_06645 [Alphaproteobacteria bacterium]